MRKHRIVTEEEWQTERDRLLAEEKELTRRSDERARKRRELPWVPVRKRYSFETEAGARSFAELFDGRSQLLIYHFMFGADYDAGCPTCSSLADTIDPQVPHLPRLRHDDDLRLLGADREGRRLQAPDALELRVGLGARVQHRPRLFAAGTPRPREPGPVPDDPPQILTQNAEATGTDPLGNASQGSASAPSSPTTARSTAPTRRPGAASSS